MVADLCVLVLQHLWHDMLSVLSGFQAVGVWAVAQGLRFHWQESMSKRIFGIIPVGFLPWNLELTQNFGNPTSKLLWIVL